MKKRFFPFIILIVYLFSLLAPLTPVRAQAGDPVADLIARLTPEQKVGQLFLVRFNGTDLSETSEIYDLIANHYVGGVALTAANDNFVAAPDTANGAFTLINSLQQTEWDAARNPKSPSSQHPYIPLFVGISQEGGGSPNDQILSGLTPIPDQMALGATWDRSLAQKSGEIMGRELSALGFNFYFGLSLDVLNAPSTSVDTGLGTRVFGGDPYWVGKMGQAFIAGLRDGSKNRMAVITKHFPGRGGSDRLPDQEVPTVRRSLDELKQIDLAPFFAVTGAAPSPETTADGVLVSHIRYQGFQGNVRPSTRPISFDQQALSQVLALPQMQPWRNNGLIISDDLGLPSVRRFYDPDNQAFSAHQVALAAFLAGNDMIYMGNIVSSDVPTNHDTIVNTLSYFAQKYRKDAVFASAVDESLRRILTIKYRIYPSFAIPAVLSSPLKADTIGQSTDHVFAVARQAATLISPSQSELSAVLPSPPKSSDYLVFITDVGANLQCSTCPQTPAMPVDAIQSAVTRLYGPSAAGLVIPNHLSSYTFADVDALLQDSESQPNLLKDLTRANIVVISALDLPAGHPQTITLSRFLTEKQSALSDKKVILFSFGAPYYLDSTTISKLDAYYGMYSHSAPFVEVAARLLFQEIAPLGTSPVSIPGTGYSLATATSPDPTQVISLSVELLAAETPTPGPDVTIEPTATATEISPLTPTMPPQVLLELGDTIAIRTGVILDRNKHPVPDGTIVQFVLSQSEKSLVRQVEATTTDGVATASFNLDQLGLINIVASSGPARNSATFQLNVNNTGGAPATIIMPTTPATPTPTEIPPTPQPTPKPGTILTTPEGYPTFLGWFLTLLLMAAGVALAYWFGIQFAQARWAVRWALLTLLGGLAAYNYLVLELPGGSLWVSEQGLSAVLQAILFGQSLGFLAGWAWRLMAERRKQTQE